MELTRQSLLEYRKDLSQFLIHLTRSGDLRRSQELYSLSKDDWISIKAKDSLINILKNRRIEAKSMFGYFKFKVRFVRPNGTVRNKTSQIQHDWLKSVCFTETPIDHVHLQTKKIYGRQMQFEPYGLAFREDVVLRRNGNPLFYFYSSNSLIKNSLDQLCFDPTCVKYKSVMPYFQEFGPPLFSRESEIDIDFRWEREWRVSGDFSFSLSDVAFGLCPKEDNETFKTIVNNQFPFVDLNDDMNSIKNELKKWSHLRSLK